MKTYRLSDDFGARIIICTDGVKWADSYSITEIRDLDDNEIIAGFNYTVGDYLSEGALLQFARTQQYSLEAYWQGELIETLYEFDRVMQFTINVGDSDSFTIPALGDNDFVIDWGDGTVEPVDTHSPAHIYTSAGTYQISIEGTMPLMAFNATGDCTKVVSVENMGDTRLTSGLNMWKGCTSLTSINLDGFVAPSNMQEFLSGCTALTDCQCHFLEMGGVSNMWGMFRTCSALTSLDVELWDVSQVTKLIVWLDSCTNLTSLDVSKWNTKSLIDAGWAFQSCSSLTELDVSNWDLSSCRYMDSFIAGCSSLTVLETANWNTSNIVSFEGFAYNSGLQKIYTRNWDMSSMESIAWMFQNAEDLVLCDCSLWDTTNMTDCQSVFSWCYDLKIIDVSNWTVDKVGDLRYAFNNCVSAVTIDMTNWKLSTAYQVGSIARECTLMTTEVPADQLWNRSPAIAGYANAFTNSILIANYADIPDAWKGLAVVTPVAEETPSDVPTR